MRTLNEVKANNPEELEMELEAIQADYEDFGPEGFYAVPFSRFREEFPEFTENIIKSFLLDMGILTKAEYANVDNLGDDDGNYWETGNLILPDDWPALIDGAYRLLTTRKNKGIQWEKIYKSHYKPIKEDLNSDVYNALSDVAYEYEVEKEEPVYEEDFIEAEDNFNDKFFNGTTPEDFEEELNEGDEPLTGEDDVDLAVDEAWPFVKEYMDWYLDPNQNISMVEVADKDGVTYDDALKYDLFNDRWAWFDPEVGIVETGWYENDNIAKILDRFDFNSPKYDELVNTLVEKAKLYVKEVLDSRK